MVFRLRHLALLALLFVTPVRPVAAQFWSNEEESAPYGTGREGKCNSVDLVLAMDTTHSMATAIREMKREAVRIVDLIKFVSAGDFRLGLITFKDRVTVELDLGAIADPEKARQEIIWAIRRLQAEGGRGGPEASDEALRTAVLGLSSANRPQDGDFSAKWSAHSRLLVLITDNLPGGFDDDFKEGVDDVNAREVTTEALMRDIRISSVYIPTSGFQMAPDPRVEGIMRAYPQLTGGVFAVTNESGRGVAEAIAKIVDQCGMRPMS